MTTPSTPRSWPLPRGLIVLLTFAAATITMAGLHEVSSLVGPSFLALVLTIAVHPIRNWMTSRGMPAWLGMVAGLLSVYLLLLAVSVALVVSVARFGTLLPTYQQQFNDLVSQLQQWLADLGVGNSQIRSVASSFDLGRLSGFIGGLISSLLGIVTSLLFIATVALFMAIDGSKFPAHLRVVSGTRAPVVEALGSFASGTRRYLVVSTVFGFIVAVIDTLLLWGVGVPVPLLWGLLAFITNYIPNVGFVIGLVPPAILALLEGGPVLMLVVIAAYSVINFVIQSVIQPKFVGDAVGLSTTITFLSLVFWAWVLGPLGALLAIPLSLLAKALLIDIDPSTAWVRPLLSGTDASPVAATDPADE